MNIMSSCHILLHIFGQFIVSCNTGCLHDLGMKVTDKRNIFLVWNSPLNKEIEFSIHNLWSLCVAQLLNTTRIGIDL